MKAKIASAVIVITTTLVWQAGAQIHEKASEGFREVNGQLYNIQKSKLWVSLNLRFVREKSGLVFAQTITNQPIYETRYDPPLDSGETWVRMGGAWGGDVSAHLHYGYYKVKTGEEFVLGKIIALKNCRSKNLTAGEDFRTVAIRVGTYPEGEKRIQLWDCGTAYVPPPLTPSQIEAAKEAKRLAVEKAKARALKAHKQRSDLIRNLPPRATLSGN